MQKTTVGRFAWLRTSLCGLLVGAADIVPGISGGTVAFIIGIYEELLASIATINRKNCLQLLKGNPGAISWKFLMAFLLGVGISFISLAKGFQYLLNHESLRPLLYALFMGLVVGSVIFCAKLVPKFTLKATLLLCLGATIAYILSGSDLAPQSGEACYNVPLSEKIQSDKPLTNYDAATNSLLGVPESQIALMLAKKQLAKETILVNTATQDKIQAQAVIQEGTRPVVDLWVICCGALAISAMLLPGISGSYLLNVLGMYGFILGALVDFVEGIKTGYFDACAFRTVFSMGIGIAFGAIVFARVVNYLFANYREGTLAVLVGFMIGALRSVWPFWAVSYQLSPPHLAWGPVIQVVEPIMPTFFSTTFALSCLFFTLGIGAVLLVEYLASKKKSRLVMP